MRPNRPRIHVPTLPLCGLVVVWLHCWCCAWAADFAEGFEGEQPSWSVHQDKSSLQVVAHRRVSQVKFGGEACEGLQLVAREGSVLRLEHELPAALAIDDLKLSVRVRSNRAGGRLLLRAVFPHQIDPRTRQPLTIYLRGDSYTEAGRWQELLGTATERQIQDHLRPLRDLLNEPNLDTRSAFVDRAVFGGAVEPGTVELFLDELRFGPVVKPPEDARARARRGSDSSGGRAAATVHLGRLLVEGRPFFPLMAADHGEQIETLEQAGLNVVWLPDFRDADRLAALRRHGLWATAVPPQAVGTQDRVLDAARATMLPFGDETAPILFWNLGTRIPAEARGTSVDWMDQIRRADRRFERPILADVVGLERMFSRHLELLGTSRHVLHTTLSLKSYRDWLIERHRLARPGTFNWTWIQTEPASGRIERREAAGATPIVVEPEQLRLQLFAALSAGCRGIGFWKTTPLDGDDPGALERRLALTQSNLEMQLLEPLLATAGGVDRQAFGVERKPERAIGRSQIDFQSPFARGREQDVLLRQREHQLKRNAQVGSELEAAVIRTDFGILILMVWYETDAQFVPGQMAANNATIVVPGVPASFSAWEITTTGIRSLVREHVAGGVKITLPKFDHTAAIVLTPDREFVAALSEKVKSVAPKSAEVCVELAAAKLDRTRQVDAELQGLGAGQPDGPQLLDKAQWFVDQARAARETGDYEAARRAAANAMQLTRILQRAHWQDAVHSLASPVSSPHTLCFQTLPDHWRMVARLGRSPNKLDADLLPSGDFEDAQAILAEQWRHSQNDLEGIQAAVDLYQAPTAGPGKGEYVLRMVAVPRPGQDLPQVVEQSPVTVTTPAVEVHGGQIVHISGWVRVAAPIIGSLDGAMLFDSVAGPAGALRWHGRSGWQRFELIREIERTGPLSLTMSLTGLGEVQFDDLRIVPLDPPREPALARDGGGEEAQSAGRFDFLNRIPRLRPFGK